MGILVHDIPGRLRFVVPHLKGDRPASEEVQTRARGIPGVITVSATSLTGSLVVTYDTRTVTRERVVQGLDQVVPGVAASAASPSRPRAADRVLRPRSVTAAMADALVEVLVERAVRAAVTALA